MELSNKHRILIFIDWFLPGYKAGGPIQSCANMVDHLKDEFDFWVITRDTDYCDDKPYADIVPDTWNKLDEHLQVFYVSASNIKYSTLIQAARTASADVVFINGIYSLYFSILPLRIARQLGCKKIIVSARGMLTPSAIQVKAFKKKVFLRLGQIAGLYRGVLFHATNDAEAEHIRRQFGVNSSVVVAPNLPKKRERGILPEIPKEVQELLIVSIARVSPEKNTRYALEVLRNYNYDGRIVFDIYGPVYDEAYWAGCENILKELPDKLQVNYKGSLDSGLVHSTLQQYHALFMPTRGENFGHIILESLTAGVPVLISDQTPWQQLEAKGVGYSLPLTEPRVFAEALQQLLNLDQAKFTNLSEAAYLYAQGFVQNKEAISQNINLFK